MNSLNSLKGRNLTMLVDFYEMTMANGYLKNGMGDTVAYFDMFFRKVPDGGGYVIMAGIEQLCEYLKGLSSRPRISNIFAARGSLKNFSIILPISNSAAMFMLSRKALRYSPASR